MHPDEQSLITNLATQISQDQPVAKDPEAAALIDQTIANQPDAVYILAQAVLVQEQALHAAQQQINDLNVKLAAASQAPAPAPMPAPSGASFLGHLFGRATTANASVAPASAPAGTTSGGLLTGGHSFLRSAASTAVGFAAGQFLFQGVSDVADGIGDLFSGD